ncbi:hypothetical protein OO014_06335 [Intrasporangium calvum]|uniref:Uncharacterized protein n=1 Tax=Intrasporangium calvum TaxID=53358 RepID=A0ABT5GGM6_9MICO|nr:hypothetical protein [Intrasporangium calvum]MDC5696871.1 hypothetical protein [Intrasporangium calvum]
MEAPSTANVEFVAGGFSGADGQGVAAAAAVEPVAVEAVAVEVIGDEVGSPPDPAELVQPAAPTASARSAAPTLPAVARLTVALPESICSVSR